MLDIRPKSLVGIEGLTDRPPRSRKMALTRPCRRPRPDEAHVPGLLQQPVQRFHRGKPFHGTGLTHAGKLLKGVGGPLPCGAFRSESPWG